MPRSRTARRWPRNRIYGTVDVAVSLDAQSHVTRVQIARTPSAILNNAALNAARHSAFQTEIRDCRPVATQSLFAVDFVGPGDPMGNFFDASATKVMGEGFGRIDLPPTAVTIRIEFAANGASAGDAVSADDAAYERFIAKLVALSAPLPPIVNEYYSVLPAANPGMPPGDGFWATHGIALTVAPSAPLHDIVRAASGAGASSATIQYTATPRATDVAAAVAVALEAAQTQARGAAKARGLRVGALLGTRTVDVRGPVPTPVALGGAR